MKLFPKSLLAVFILTSFACTQEKVYVPKPRMYPKVDFPERNYTTHDIASCPYVLEFPDYGRIEKDNTFFESEAPNPCWFNLNMPIFNGTIHCSYYEITDREHFDKLVQDAFKLTGKHHVRADYVEEEMLNNGEDVTGFMFRVQGPSASPIQFYLTDSTRHFLRGALYFNNQVQPDSMRPVYEFVEKDIYHLISNFRWKK